MSIFHRAHVCKFLTIFTRLEPTAIGGELWITSEGTARVDVFTSPFFFAVRTKESNTSANFCANAWICARLTTDRDLDSSNTTKRVNAWICALLTTDHDPASVIPDKKRKSVSPVFFFTGPIVF